MMLLWDPEDSASETHFMGLERFDIQLSDTPPEACT